MYAEPLIPALVGDPLKSKPLFSLLGHFPFPIDLIIFIPGKPKNSKEAEQSHKIPIKMYNNFSN